MMKLTDLHATLLGTAIEKILGKQPDGSMAYVRCLPDEIVQGLAKTKTFAPVGWKAYRVADVEDLDSATITADIAVEIRETKSEPVVLLVDTRAGAGMDGIYSAAREITEKDLFHKAIQLATSEITRRLSKKHREYAEKSVKKARGRGHRIIISPWTEFNFFIRIASEKRHPAELLFLIGMWPVRPESELSLDDQIDLSVLFVDRFFGPSTIGVTPAAKIESMRFVNMTEEQRIELGLFLRTAASKPLFEALEYLADKKMLWIDGMVIELTLHDIQSLLLTPWRKNSGELIKWSGLTKGPADEDAPRFLLAPDALHSEQVSKLEIRWKSQPANLPKGSVEYNVSLVTDMDEELASKTVTHRGRNEEKCTFTNDDFSTLNDDAVIPVKAIVRVIGNDSIAEVETEDFIIQFGEQPQSTPGSIGRKVRALSEGIIELAERTSVTEMVNTPAPIREDSKNFLQLRISNTKPIYRVYRPSLVKEVETQWIASGGRPGYWRAKVRSSGIRAGEIEFIPLPGLGEKSIEHNELWERVVSACRRLSERFAQSLGAIGQIYDEQSKGFDSSVKEYILAWIAVFDKADHRYSLVNTVEIQTQSGKTIGLIVLPSHPLRVAWHVAYDNLVLYSRFELGMLPKEVRDELASLDGSMFPAFLPATNGEGTFVFGDTLGFHCVGMVLDTDSEPKASLALLAKSLGRAESADVSPTVGTRSSEILGREIVNYLNCHNTSPMVHVHALRPGDASTIARALGRVHQDISKHQELTGDEIETQTTPAAFVLELYPSQHKHGISGRFISGICAKRRSGTGTLAQEDLWMLESIQMPSGVMVPRLRWARRDNSTPDKPAHIAVAFDTFDSRVGTMPSQTSPKRPIFAYGLLSFYERAFGFLPSPLWLCSLPTAYEGEKHPSERGHTERLLRIQTALQKTVVSSLGGMDGDLPALKTEIHPEKAESLASLHALCDWVITVDRNAGIEYFDSPRDNGDIYNAYIIDCVPEREDLGCLQMITTTGNLAEIRTLFDRALDQMGLSRSRRSAEFLLTHLKSLSGRLAIRLTGQGTVSGELIALALVHANCLPANTTDPDWLPLNRGFFIPVDDVYDLLPVFGVDKGEPTVRNSRSDLIHVSIAPRGGLVLSFVEVKFRRHLMTASNPADLLHLRQQIETLRKRWWAWYSDVTSPVARTIRRAKLARILRFYADKAGRHYLDPRIHQEVLTEIDKMVATSDEYTFPILPRSDRGYIFCPEYLGQAPSCLSPAEWDSRMVLFGPSRLQDSSFRYSDSIFMTPVDDAGEVCESPEDVSKDGCIDQKELADTVRGENLPADRQSLGGQEQSECVNVSFGKDLYTGEPVIWHPSIKGNPHLLIVGMSGMGKTTCLINICQQIWQQGVLPIVFSHHPDIDDKLSQLFTDVRFVDYNGLGFNPLKKPANESRRTYLDVASEMRDIFLAIYTDLGDIQGEYIRKAIKQSYLEMGWDQASITSPAVDYPEPQFKRFLEILRESPKHDRGLKTLLTRLDELDDYGFFETGDTMGAIWESTSPVIIRIHSTQNENMQRAFSTLLFYGFYKEMFYRKPQKGLKHIIVFDEAHRSSRLKLIPTMAQECRKFGIGLLLASQKVGDFHQSIFSLVANYLLLRMTDSDARILVRNVTSSDLERRLIDRIKMLEKYKAIFFSEGARKPVNVELAPM